MAEVDKNELRKQFSKDWEKHYKINSIVEMGFTRQKCKKCGRNFWSGGEREYCADATCIGYPFIGKSPSRRKLGYVETWNELKKYFSKHGHGIIDSYPTVARWRDDLYFTIASINDFQPYVVNGELPPPHNPLLIPQHCIRFPDIANVGVTGRHYTNFVMVGQHAFNTKKTGLFYWKDEALMHDVAYLKMLGIPKEELVFMEDVWAGGGNYGPSMEYFVGGLELGNCVFMQYEILPDGSGRELQTKVIDMGAGLERLAWITNDTATSYEVVFGPVIKYMKKEHGVSVDEKLFAQYARMSGSLNIDEVADVEAEKEAIAKKLGISKQELFAHIEPLQALYATGDHLLTVLSAVTDGMLPSNAGGGYNLRLILRRAFGFEEEYGFKFDYAKILELHAQHLLGLFPNLKSGVASTADVIAEEKKKYETTKQKAHGKVVAMLSKGKESKIGTEELMVLYKSHGVPPEFVEELAKKSGVTVHIPGNFYGMASEKEGEAKKNDSKIDVVKFDKTESLYYGESGSFLAKVLSIVDGKYVVLDKSAFYPESGGQVGDMGTLNEIIVKNTQKEAGVVLHEVSGEDISKFKAGQKVKGDVDIERRKTITRHHTAAHLLNAACREVLGNHIWQGGSNKDEERAHLDVTHYKRITQEEIDKIEIRVNEYIACNVPIIVEVLPRNVAESKYGFTLYQGGAVPGKELRVVSIEGIDTEACGGTHHMLKSTGEIGCFKIVKREGIQDGIERITYKCGTVAIAYVQSREKLLRDAAAVISVSETDLQKNVERFFNEWKEQRKKIGEFSEVFAKNEAAEIIKESATNGKTSVRILDADAETLRKIGNIIIVSDCASAILINKLGDTVCASGNKSVNARELMQKLASKFGGGGGGNEKLASGKIQKVEKFVV